MCAALCRDACAGLSATVAIVDVVRINALEPKICTRASWWLFPGTILVLDFSLRAVNNVISCGLRSLSLPLSLKPEKEWILRSGHKREEERGRHESSLVMSWFIYLCTATKGRFILTNSGCALRYFSGIFRADLLETAPGGKQTWESRLGNSSARARKTHISNFGGK